jgi:hypothetical protein
MPKFSVQVSGPNVDEAIKKLAEEEGVEITSSQDVVVVEQHAPWEAGNRVRALLERAGLDGYDVHVQGE